MVVLEVARCRGGQAVEGATAAGKQRKGLACGGKVVAVLGGAVGAGFLFIGQAQPVFPVQEPDAACKVGAGAVARERDDCTGALVLRAVDVGQRALVCCLGVVGGVAWLWQLAELTAQQENARIAAVREQLLQIRTPVATQADPRRTSSAQAAQLLQRDLNLAFSTVEHLQEPGARLRGLSWEAAANTLRLEYALDSVLKAATVTEALNAGDERRPWQLESVGGAGANGASGSVSMTSGPPAFRGVWAVKFPP